MKKPTNQNFPDNVLYEADNLDILRGMNSETVDLIATDPPFNTKRNRSGTAGFYVDKWKFGDTGILPDQWKWNEVHPKWMEEIKDDHEPLYHAIDAARYTQGEDTAAFLCFLSVRLLEMHRILKPTGSIYLHCDDAVNAYIRTCMDAVFGAKNFRNEITWRRIIATKRNKYAPRGFGRNTETLLRYSKTGRFIHNPIYLKPTQEELQKKFPHVDANGRRYKLRELFRPPGLGPNPGTCYEYKGVSPPHASGWLHTKENLMKLDAAGDIVWIEGKMPRRKLYADEYDGVHLSTLWDDIYPPMGDERTGSPDQKPVLLYERIVKASSNEGDIVLDPFCGCATTTIAANNLCRRWVGIDRRVDARYHIITRLMGVTRKERARIEKFATDAEWLERQTEKYEFHFKTAPPVRTDDAPSELAQVYHTPPEKLHTHAEMRELLVGEFGVKCWGCNFEPPDERYLHLDHITPKSEGGTNHIDNRALLCQPCNSKKSNTMTLTALRRSNKRDGHLQAGESVNLTKALYWTRERLIEKVRETSSQYR